MIVECSKANVQPVDLIGAIERQNCRWSHDGLTQLILLEDAPYQASLMQV